MPKITSIEPQTWQELEQIVTDILSECGMEAERNVSLDLPRGNVDVDVLAKENVDGIIHQTVCECKNWSTNIPKEVVHAFRTVMQETGANRGYIMPKTGFQGGAIKAAEATNISLVTFLEFQDAYFKKWFKKSIWALENKINGFHTYYEPLGKPGYHQLSNDDERSAYDEVWNKYLFAGLILIHFSPYMQMIGEYPIPALPFDVSELEKQGVVVPEDIKVAEGYRDFFYILERNALAGLQELRAVNPITRGKSSEEIVSED